MQAFLHGGPCDRAKHRDGTEVFSLFYRSPTPLCCLKDSQGDMAALACPFLVSLWAPRAVLIHQQQHKARQNGNIWQIDWSGNKSELHLRDSKICRQGEEHKKDFTGKFPLWHKQVRWVITGILDCYSFEFSERKTSRNQFTLRKLIFDLHGQCLKKLETVRTHRGKSTIVSIECVWKLEEFLKP